MKTVRQHLETFPEPYRTQALKNATPSRLNEFRHQPEQALIYAFNWAGTPERKDYWQSFYTAIRRGELRPPTQNREPWNDEEVSVLTKLFSENRNEAIGSLLNRSASAVANKARRLKLEKSKAYMEAYPVSTFKPVSTPKLSFWRRLEKFIFPCS